MAEEEKKIIVDSDWKAEAKRDKERLAQETAAPEVLPAPTFAELVNIIMVQVLSALGLLPGPDGRPIAANLEVAKHFIDMLQLVEEKTRNNLTPDEKTLLERTLYETRMAFVEMAGGGMAGARPSYSPPRQTT